MTHSVYQSRVLPYCAKQMYTLVNDIASYPEFLPHCTRARLLFQTPELIEGELELSRGGIHQCFTTRNHLIMNKSIMMTLVEGPFSHFKGHWQFQDLGSATCKVEFQLVFRFKNKMLDVLFAQFFKQISATMIDAFQKRAESVYGYQKK